MNYYLEVNTTNITLEELSSFSDRMWSIRAPHNAYIKYRFIDNPFCKEEFDSIYIVKNSSEEIIAQMQTMPAPLIYKNQIISAYWGQDYIVDNAYRGTGIGKNLSDFYFSKDYYIAVGFSEKSAVIHRKMGAKSVGFLNFYYKKINLFQKLKFIYHRLSKHKNPGLTSYIFPKEINLDDKSFTLIDDPKDFVCPKPQWNENIIESVRNENYIKWRFFHKKNRYFLYQLKTKNPLENPPYFVVHPVFWKGINCLRITDFRYNVNNKTDLEAMLEAAELIAKKLNLFTVTIASSHKTANEIIATKNYKLLKEEIVLTTYPFNFEEAEKCNDKLIINFCDSDLDMFSSRGNFIYDENY